MSRNRYFALTRRSGYALILLAVSGASAQEQAPACRRTITAQVVALEQPLFFNRLGAWLPGGMMYALKSDVVPKPASGDPPSRNAKSCADAGVNCQPGNVILRLDKRPRPIVLRANVGDCLEIQFTNYISNPPGCPGVPLPQSQTCTRNAGVHVAGLELVNGIQSDSSFIGVNPNSLVSPGAPAATFTYYAKAEGNFFMYSFDDGNANVGQWDSGLFGSVNVQPEGAEWYRSQVTNQDLKDATFNKYHLPNNMSLQPPAYGPNKDKSVVVEGEPHVMCILTTHQPGPAGRDTVTTANVYIAVPPSGTPETVCVKSAPPPSLKPGEGDIYTLSGHPVVDYDAIYGPQDPQAGKPILSLLKPPHLKPCGQAEQGAKLSMSGEPTPCGKGELVGTDLTAIITGPYADRFPYSADGPEFHNVPALPDRRQPYREFSIFYHVSNWIVQAFPDYYSHGGDVPANTPLGDIMNNGEDAFAVNYGSGGIGSEILANRLGSGPEKDCKECKFEEFFLSSWSVGDPAMVVDRSDKLKPYGKYPDDPSNVYHSYVRDHVKFRIFNASATQQHVHHQHAHQWLHTANDDSSTYLDSQLIVPGAAYTLNMVYGGSGNRNATIGDSIFHCHFYPHFAAGMWSLWRVHDTFEEGTLLQTPSPTQANGKPVTCAPADDTCWNRALPDGELAGGSPIPALVPIPTLGMAPKPSRVRLVEGGKRAYVQPETSYSTPRKTSAAKPQATAAAAKPDTSAAPDIGAGTYKYEVPNDELRYKNPGYPFFVPGVGGHRPPHPPLDFAWAVDDKGEAIKEKGERIPLDGGLPRHIVLDGQIVREFHTQYDFSKDFSAKVPQNAPPQNQTLVLGTMFAEQLPETGTPIERAAMASQSRRSVPTYSPDGLPGNFTLNGLPPAHGAPFARPEVDDNGDVVSNIRRYMAAVVQRDVVLNRDGWHYPQQRFLTLWQDVNDTMSGKRPPEPLFFRVNTGETVEFWHTNLVPSYYDLDNFQVRTPTDVIGQHIHLVKFDVLASDGAGNGFNYEDGTFGPDEVRERIHVINNTGVGAKKGMYAFNEACWGATGPLTACLQQKAKQDILKVKTLADSHYPFKMPAGSTQDWEGAQTTIQRWDTDPLLNNDGRDRTMRTVFTHDHFGPSTHQNVGLYAGLVIEPDNSVWLDPQTGKQMYDRTTRFDGGPTSWQAIVKTASAADSYREFLIEYQDMQLAYTSQSITTEVVPPNPVFSTDANYTSALNSSQCFTAPPAGGCNCDGTTQPACCALRKNLCLNGLVLSDKATIQGSGPWTISDHFGTNTPQPADTYTLTTTAGKQSVTFNEMPVSWYDAAHAINSQNGQHVIDGVGTIPGTYSVNYRNEPVPLRVTNPTNGNQLGGQIGDLSYAFVSGLTRNDAHLNAQSDNGGAIPGSSGAGAFHFPACPLDPTQLPAGTGATCPWTAPCVANGTCVQPTDPYTPMMRAFQGDRVQIRTLAGAHVFTHPVMVRGVKWRFEPSALNSGYKNAQDTGLSEHYEFLFRLPFSQNNSSLTHAADYLYQASSGLKGTTNGLWGLLRAYSPSSTPVGLEKLPPTAVPPPTATAPQACPDTAPVKKFEVYAIPASQLPGGALNYNSRSTPSPVLAKNALIYVLDNGPGVTGNLAKVKSGVVGAEPLILRVNAGDCAQVTLKNTLTKATVPQNTNVDFPWNENPTPLPAISLNTSAEVGLSPQLVSYDVTRDAGFNVGFNPDQVVQPQGTAGDSKLFTWYAGNLAVRNGKTVGVPLELGTANLLPSDPLMQDRFGLGGILVVEPLGATWTVDGGTQAAATVTRTITLPDGTPRTQSFREFVVVAQDGDPDQKSTQIFAFNYRTEPLNNRNWPGGFADISKFYSNSAVSSLEPQTPVFTAPANAQVRFRVGRPGQDDDLVFAIHGHVWQEEPYTNNSAEIGFNPLSNWLGTQQIGANERYDFLVGKAGGTFNISGDYMYHMLTTSQFGLWGLMRATPDALAIQKATWSSGNPLAVSGTVSKPVNGGAIATTVTIWTVVDLPSGGCTPAGMRPCLQPVGTASVNAADGSWSASIPSLNLQPGTAVRAQSNLGGQSTVNPTP